jgi:hypothetical protein
VKWTAISQQKLPNEAILERNGEHERKPCSAKRVHLDTASEDAPLCICARPILGMRWPWDRWRKRLCLRPRRERAVAFRPERKKPAAAQAGTLPRRNGAASRPTRLAPPTPIRSNGGNVKIRPITGHFWRLNYETSAGGVNRRARRIMVQFDSRGTRLPPSRDEPRSFLWSAPTRRRLDRTDVLAGFRRA